MSLSNSSITENIAEENLCLLFSSGSRFSKTNMYANSVSVLISGLFLRKLLLNIAGGLKERLYKRAACAHLFLRTDKQCK